MEYALNSKILINSVEIPMMGLGGWAQKKNEIIDALNVGYRLIDTAWQYGNENEVGCAIRDSGLSRDDIFVTTKLWNDSVRSGEVKNAFEESLKNLQLDYVDLYLIHYPADGYELAWKQIIDLYHENKIKAIGVSNFQPHHIDKIIEKTGVVPHVNQIETHPYFANNDVISYCKEKGIAVEAWCPLGGPKSGEIKDDTLMQLAEEYKKTVAQIILRWQYQRDIITIPKSTSVKHMKENIDIFNFDLNNNDMERIKRLDKSIRLGADPDNFNF